MLGVCEPFCGACNPLFLPLRGWTSGSTGFSVCVLESRNVGPRLSAVVHCFDLSGSLALPRDTLQILSHFPGWLRAQFRGEEDCFCLQEHLDGFIGHLCNSLDAVPPSGTQTHVTAEGFCFVLDASKDLRDNDSKSIKPKENMSQEQNETTDVCGHAFHLHIPKNKVECLFWFAVPINSGSKFQMHSVLANSSHTSCIQAIFPTLSGKFQGQSWWSASDSCPPFCLEPRNYLKQGHLWQRLVREVRLMPCCKPPSGL